MADPIAPASPPAARLSAIERDASRRLAARRVEDGEPGAIGRLSRALERLDRYENVAAAPPFDELAEGAAKFDAKLDDLLRRVAGDKARAAAARGGPDGGAPQTPAGFNLPANP
ncbi:MAG: hypothetical protein ABR970_13930 [Roseiarcus sp.]